MAQENAPNKPVHLMYMIGATVLFFLTKWTIDWLWSYFTDSSPGELLMTGGAVVVAVSGMKGDSEELETMLQARAMVVRDYLVANFRMDDKRVKTMTRGKAGAIGSSIDDDTIAPEAVGSATERWPYTTARVAVQALGNSATAARTPVTSYPFRATGKLVMVFSNGTFVCSASLIKPAVLVTAAHCIQGSAKGLSFAPGFHDGTAPFGRWTVTGAYFDPAWISEGNTTPDFAFLTVAPKTLRGIPTDIQTVTGANVLSTKPSSGESVTVPAYPDGQAKVPITFTAKVYFEGIYPAFNCNPYIGGTSGSPWLVATSEGVKVVGLIAGLHQGGCYTYTSYSPPLGSDARAVYNRAVAGAKPEIGPDPGSDGCSTGL